MEIEMQYPCSWGRTNFEQAAAFHVHHLHFKTIVSMHTLFYGLSE